MLREAKIVIKYKLRIYVTSGIGKGNLDHEEFFDTMEPMDARYKQLFVHNLYSLNPTAWAMDADGNWTRIEGY